MAHRQPWLATYANYGIPATIAVDTECSVTQLLDKAMQTYAEKPAFHCAGRTLTFSDVDESACAAGPGSAAGASPATRDGGLIWTCLTGEPGPGTVPDGHWGASGVRGAGRRGRACGMRRGSP